MFIQSKEEAYERWKESLTGLELIDVRQPITLIALRQILDAATTQHGSDVQDRFTPLNCCVLDYANRRLYSVDRLACFRLDGDQVVLIQESKGDNDL